MRNEELVSELCISLGSFYPLPLRRYEVSDLFYKSIERAYLSSIDGLEPDAL
jgi:hypothetical protein